jgi:isoquinoline 1-oxidoreductase subunit beta
MRAHLSRRDLVTGALATGALVVGWQIWPRDGRPNLTAAPGETILNAFLKIGTDGHVTVVTPQVEMGQGSYTIQAQIMADELGADWRTIAVEPAPLNDIYVNELLSVDWKGGLRLPPKLQVTGGSTTQRAFEMPLRHAAAGARTLLCMAAAQRWNIGWEACETEEGFVVHGRERIRFGDLVGQAADFQLPSDIPYRLSGTRLARRGLPRLDVPAKIDGSANFASDIRLPGMLFAAIRQGPLGQTTLKSFDEKAGMAVPGVKQFVKSDRWLAAVANSWWVASRALDAARPRFVTAGDLKSDKDVADGLAAALKAEGTVVAALGDGAAAFKGAGLQERTYSVGFAPHAALEPIAATAAFDGDMLQLWIATQAPGLARAAAAQAVGIDEANVALHPLQIGGSFGRKYEIEVAAQAATLAQAVGAPVQLTWSWAEDMSQDRMRPAAQAKLSARIGAGGRIDAWRGAIATTDAVGEMVSRTVDGDDPEEARLGQVGRVAGRATDGAVPPYTIPVHEILHHPADIAVATGKLRGGAHGYTCFFNECFVDELAHQVGGDPFTFRMGLLSGNIRLAKCLSQVIQRGGWNGGAQGTNQGLACHSMLGSHIAVLAEAQMGEDGRVRVVKLTAVADAGRIMNPDIARQQIEGGLLYGMGIATGAAVTLTAGVIGPLRLGELKLPLLADMPEISVELIHSNEAAGGLGELAVPPVGPAIANALFAASGQRYRSLPLGT